MAFAADELEVMSGSYSWQTRKGKRIQVCSWENKMLVSLEVRSFLKKGPVACGRPWRRIKEGLVCFLTKESTKS